MPIDSDYTELLESEMAKNNSRVIYFSFSKEPELEESNGKIIKIENIKDEVRFSYLIMETKFVSTAL